MSRRIAMVAVVVLLMGGLTIGATATAGAGHQDAIAAKKKKKKKKKKKPPLIAVGTYSGTTSNGIQMTVVLDASRTTGSITYCAITAPFAVSGTSFAVAYTDPIGLDTIEASGVFNAKTRQVSGNVAPNGCDASAQTFVLQHP